VAGGCGRPLERSDEMQSSTGFPEREIHPQVPLHAISHWALATGEHIVLGLILGWLTIKALQAMSLRWSWAPVGLGIAALLGAAPIGTLGFAAVFAIKAGRKRDREELLLCGKSAKAARAKGGRFALLLAREVACHWRCRGGRWFSGNKLLVGYDLDRRPVEVPVQSHSGGAHTLVVGAAGSGKTVTQTWLAVRAIEAGMAAIVIDPKDDMDLIEGVRAAARRANKPFFEWSPEGSSVYNPYAGGSESEVADKALAGERFTEPHYQRQAQRYLGWEVRVLRRAGIEISLATLAEHLDPERLEMVLRSRPEAESQSGYEYLDALSARQRSDLCGVKDRLSILAESDVGRWLDPRTPQTNSFDLLSCLRREAVVLFRLRSDRRPLIMQMLGGAIVLDLLSAVGALQHASVPSIAVIDEFAALAAPHVGALFARARGAGMSLVLSTQEISDLQLPGKEGLLRQVVGNLTTTISHRQVNPESAEWVSKLGGRCWAWGATLASDGKCTYRAAQEWRIGPEQVSALAPGQAAVIVHGEQGSPRIAQMLRVSASR
jgi:hypothetical protein